MDTQEDILSFLDLLDLDEEVIDKRLKSLIVRSYHSNKHLVSAIQLLQYKTLINTQEDSDCENEEEFDFTVQLIRNVNSENIDYVCKIINIVLCLNRNNIVNKSEHLIQQILSNIDFPTNKSISSSFEPESCPKMLLNLKLCGSILDAIIKKNEKLSLPFLETPLEKILDFTDDKTKCFFLTNTVPRLFEAVIGYNILDRIWNHIILLKGKSKGNSLKILSCLSEYYIPMPDAKGNQKYESEILFLYEFWDIVLFGMTSDDIADRKISMYLSKRAIDYVTSLKKDICIQSGTDSVFLWNKNNTKNLKLMWDNYFILMDSLEEKQSNIVLPSLKLFETIHIEQCWLNAAFNIGLKHDNTQVRLKCIEYRMKTKIRSQTEAIVLLEAFNDINIYDYSTNYETLKNTMRCLLRDHTSFMEIIRAIPHVKWSPVPYYHMTDVLANLDLQITYSDIANLIIDILKVPCNHLVMRKAVQINLAHFIKNCCDDLNWRDIAGIYSVIPADLQLNHVFASLIQQATLRDGDAVDCFKTLSENKANINLILLYLINNEEYINLFLNEINKNIVRLNGIISRQYSDKKESLHDVVFLTHLISKTDQNRILLHNLHEILVKHKKTILQYILSLFSSDSNLAIEEAVMLFERQDYQAIDKDLDDTLLQLYKTAILFLNDNSELDKAVLSIYTLKMLLNNPLLINKYNHEMLTLDRFIELISKVEFKDSLNESVGRSKNIFYEKSCQIIYVLIEEQNDAISCLKEIIAYMENVLECGGYGCLKWILKIVNEIVKSLVDDETKFNMTQFINKVWNEIEELKSSNQYSPCIVEFVELITQDALLDKAMYNNVVILYCNKILEYGPVKLNPLYYLIRKLNGKGVKDYGHLIYILSEILLYSPVSRKDQRIADNVALQILDDSRYEINKKSLDVHFNFEIQYLSIATLCHIEDVEILRTIIKFVTSKVDDIFRNKLRYHGNSQIHRMLLTTLQHILIIILKSAVDIDWLLNWSLSLLAKLPHQPSVRICLEWLVALCFYIKKAPINKNMLGVLKLKNVPLPSQFYITYWLLKHKISNGSYTENEYDIVLDFLLSHTMGQMFNIRLHAQYLAHILHTIIKKPTKFDYIVAVIEKTFNDSNTDKNFIKLKTDYFTNDFNIISNLNPFFIYYYLSRYCELDNNENVDLPFVKGIINDVSNHLVGVENEFIVEWRSCRRETEDFVKLECNNGIDHKVVEDTESMGTIQKKYIPWKNMSDVNVYDVAKKTESPSDLIVVASLIDKLPNLGGMARTSEVFGVKTYVVDSLRHLQDRQFQGLSVSAERWINIEEVRPGRPLKDYLMQKKTEGYSIVAAEQTSSSSKLQTFKFPKKTLLLLGHEKEGVPCDLLPIMDHCVEIPQQGYVRSLNVHVTAAIFVWEYARQNIL